MSVKLIEGFDGLGSGNALSNKAISISAPFNEISFPTGRNGQQCLAITGVGSSPNVVIRVSNTYDPITFTSIVGFAFKYTAHSEIGHMVIGSHSINGDIWSLRYAGSTGTLLLYKGDGSTLLGTSAPGIIFPSVWHYIEIKFTPSSSVLANTCVVKVDGIEVINVTAGTNTLVSAGLNSIDNLRLRSSSSINNNYDDLYVADLSGSVGNDFLGDLIVGLFYPAGNGTVSGFVGSDNDTIDNYLLVDDTYPDSDNTYVYASGVNSKETYVMNQISGVQQIFAVQPNIWAKKMDIGDRRMKAMIKNASGEYTHENEKSVYPSYRYLSTLWELNPQSSGAWTQNDINTTEFGFIINV